MTLPTSGGLAASQINIELGRAHEASFSLDGTAERALAKKSYGSIGFADFYGKSSELVVTLPAGGSAVTLEGQFRADEWVSDTAKRVILAEGSERGNAFSIAPAVTTGSTPWGGSLIFEIRGVISGKGGAANSGTGGDAFHANLRGNFGQKMEVLLSGVLRGGGGGGGWGGKGGDGTIRTGVREPASGSHFSWLVSGSPAYVWRGYKGQVLWNDRGMGFAGNNGTELVNGDTTYYRGERQNYEWISFGGDRDESWPTYRIYRVNYTTTATIGGQGGIGGVGEGYGSLRSFGTEGTLGQSNAGNGGAGGSGGLYGAVGNTGNTGQNGTAAGGLNGATGGSAGYGLRGAANINLTNAGYIVGRTE